jgi:ribosomal protein L35AE/L33A
VLPLSSVLENKPLGAVSRWNVVRHHGRNTAVRVCQWEAVEPDGFGAKTTSEEESVKG